MPYLPYSRQCKMRKRGAIVAKLMAQNLSKSGFCHFITVDLHQKEIQGFFECTIDNLRASPYLLTGLGEAELNQLILFFLFVSYFKIMFL